jgi:hypothetical protein
MNDYVFDRAWLPWELDKKKLQAKPGTDVRLSLFGVLLRAPRDEAADQTPYREKFPGVMLFRDSGPRVARSRGKLCVVYLIGENPTSGIDKRSFSASLELLTLYPSKPNRQPIRVIGPYFTGSQTSLKHVLDTWRTSHPDSSFDVISGSATAVEKGQLFPDADGIAGKTTFHATVIPSDQVLWATLHYLRWRNRSRSDDHHANWRPPDQVAILVEANTRFGQIMGKQ